MNTKFFGKLGKIFTLGIVTLLSVGMFGSFANAAVTGITITAPNGGEAWNGTQNITWTCTDDGSSPTCADTKVDSINYSPDNGANWENTGYVNNTQFANSGSFSWDTTAIPNTESTSGLIEIVLNSPSVNNTSAGTFIVDNTPPTISSATTNDSDGNGKIDQLIVKFNESMDNAITSTSGITYTAYLINTDGVWSTTTNTNDTLTIPVTENSIGACNYSDQTGCDTDNTDSVLYTPGTLVDLAGNIANTYGPTPVTDGAKPAMVGAETLDTNSNGYIDTIKVQFSEDLNGTTVNSSGTDFSVVGYSVAGASETSTGKVTILLNELSGIGGDTDATPEISIISGQSIQDNATIPNSLGYGNTGSTVTPLDGASPVAMKSEYFTWLTTPSKVDRFRVYFSEPISATAQGSFSNIPGEIAVTPNGLTGLASPTSIKDNTDGTNVVYFQGPGTNDLTGANGGGEPTWTYTYNNTDTLQDNAGNHWTTVLLSAKTMIDKANPVVVKALTLDKNSDGISGTLELRFSEDINDTGWYAKKWLLSSDGGSFFDPFLTSNTGTTVLNGGISVVNDEYVSMNIASPSAVVGTGVMKYMYTQNDVKDLAGNLLAGIPATQATDGAKPVILAFNRVSSDGQYFNAGTHTITVTFTEPLTIAPKIAINTTGTDLSATPMTIGSDAKTRTYNYSVPSSSDGLATITLSYGADAVPNVMNSDSSHTFVIDTTDPTMSISSPTVNSVVHETNGEIPFAFNASDTNLDTCAYEVAGSGIFTNLPSCTSPQNITLADGRHTVTLRATDLAGNIKTDSVNFVVDTDGILTVNNATSPTPTPDFTKIQDAIDAWVSGITTIDVATGMYYENININEPLAINGANSGIDPNTGTRVSESVISSSGAGTIVNVSSDGVTVDGFIITNGNLHSGVGIYSSDHNNLTVKNNIITDIGNTSDNIVGRGIEVISVSSVVDNTTIKNNKINAITSGKNASMSSSGTSASAISIGWSAGSNNITDLLIQNNVILGITANTNDWVRNSADTAWLSKDGYGAYGILINHKTPGAQIIGNTISDLEGLWAHGIGLEGNTPNAVVTGNTISDLTDHKSPADAVGIHIEDNPSAGSVKINDNSFGYSISIGVDSVGSSIGTVDATNNWWGDATGPFNYRANPTGNGPAVYPSIADATALSLVTSVDFSPFYNSAGMDTLVSVDPIASFNLSFNPNPQMVNATSTLTVTAKDAGGYTVVNDAATQISLTADNGASFGASLLTIGIDGNATTTVTNSNSGMVNVNALEVGGLAAGTGQIEFTLDPIVIDDIIAVQSSAVADGTYANGWHYIYKITVNTNETDLFVNFANWSMTGGGSGTVSANGHMRLLFNTATGNGPGSSVGSIPETDIENGFGNVDSYEIGNSYIDQKLGNTAQAIDISGVDTSTRAGRQIQFDVYTKLPTNTPIGFYETTYGIKTQ